MAAEERPRRTSNRHPHLTEPLRDIINAFAMHEPPRGMVKLCSPTEIETMLSGPDGKDAWVGNNGKVCYPPDGAVAAAKAIRDLPGADPVVPYPCPRGPDEHWHLVDEERRLRTLARVTATIYDAARRAGRHDR